MYGEHLFIPLQIILQEFGWTKEKAIEIKKQNDRLKDLTSLADKLGCSPTQLSIAWSLKHEPVQCLLLGATTAEQLHQSLQALQVNTLQHPSVRVPVLYSSDRPRIAPSCCRASPPASCSSWSGSSRTNRYDRRPSPRWPSGDNQPAPRDRPARVAAAASVGQIHRKWRRSALARSPRRRRPPARRASARSSDQRGP